eukprot:8506343-Pyramimonas_sp.AAC.1
MQSKQNEGKKEAPPNEGKAPQKTTDYGIASFAALFRYATSADYFMILFGGLGAAFVGITQPMSIILFADVMDASSGTTTTDISYVHRPGSRNRLAVPEILHLLS